ncbi:hypothetical protein CBL_13065 [Carabus blaptoides fortunei]
MREPPEGMKSTLLMSWMLDLKCQEILLVRWVGFVVVCFGGMKGVVLKYTGAVRGINRKDSFPAFAHMQIIPSYSLFARYAFTFTFTNCGPTFSGPVARSAILAVITGTTGWTTNDLKSTSVLRTNVKIQLSLVNTKYNSEASTYYKTSVLMSSVHEDSGLDFVVVVEETTIARM